MSTELQSVVGWVINGLVAVVLWFLVQTLNELRSEVRSLRESNTLHVRDMAVLNVRLSAVERGEHCGNYRSIKERPA